MSQVKAVVVVVAIGIAAAACGGSVNDDGVGIAQASAQSARPLVAGSGTLEPQYGSPTLHVSAQGEGANARGQFFIEYPSGCTVHGTVVCTYISGNLAYAVGEVTKVESNGDARCDIFTQGEYVNIGILDADATAGTDFANFSRSYPSATAPVCGTFADASPVLPVVDGNFVVKQQ